MKQYVAAVAVLLLLAAVPVWAQPAPSFLGPTGLLFVPTADVVGMGEFNVGGAVARFDETDISWISGNVGLLPQLEVGATLVKPEHADSEAMLNAKYRLLKPALTATTLSVGMIDITDEVSRSAYAVLTHNVGAGLVLREGPFSNPRVHVGVGGGLFDGVFLGGEVTVGSKVDLIGEYDSHDFNFGARFPLSKSFELTAAVLDNFDDVGVGAAFTSPW